MSLTSNFWAGSGLCGGGCCVGIGVVVVLTILSQLIPFLSSAGMDDVVVVVVMAVVGGTETMERIRALQTPLQQITVGSGRRLSTQT